MYSEDNGEIYYGKVRYFSFVRAEGQSKYWLYNQLGMSYQNFSKMISNETKSIRYENIEAICQLLNRAPSDIIKLDT